MFEDTRANIVLLEKNEENITMEQLIDTICRLFDDASGKNRKVKDIIKYGYALVELYYRLLPAYNMIGNKLLELKDDDVTDVKSKIDEIETKFCKVRPLLESLNREKIELEKKEKEYNSEIEKKDRLEKRIAELKNISIEEIKNKNSELEDELRKKEENNTEFEHVELELNRIKTEKEKLEGIIKKYEDERIDIEKEVADLNESIADYENWKKEIDRTIENNKEIAEESINKLTLIRNACRSIESREDIAARVEELSIFASTNTEFKTFSDILNWMEGAGNDIESALDIYAEMYKHILDSVKSD